MKRLVIVTALAGALAACGNPAEESDEPVAAETTAMPTEAVADSSAGTYEVTLPDGSKMTSVLSPDGTYQDMDAAGAVAQSGTWVERDGQTCFTPADGEPETCYTVSEQQADGTMTATPADGSEPLTIRKTG